MRIGSKVEEKAFEVFWDAGGYSYDPKKETRFEAKERCAAELVEAEHWAQISDYEFEWSIDELDSGEWSDEKPAWRQWRCIMRDSAGAVVQSLNCIDFGKDSPDPWGKPYKRVVEAELALEERYGRAS